MKYKINLVTLKKETLADRFIYFALNYLRYILVITQIVVIVVFFIKFKVDQDIIDLKEAVGQKQEIIFVSRPLTEEAKRISQKLNEIHTLLSGQEVLATAFDYLLSIFPSDLFLDTLSIEGTTIKLIGRSTNPNTIKAFLTRLQKEGHFKTVNLSSIRKVEGELHFTFELDEFKN